MMPLDGFSLACNIFQAISFTREVCKQVKQIVEEGQNDFDLGAIKDAHKKLDEFCTEIDKSAAAISHASNSRNAKAKSLLTVAQDCKKATKEFRDVILRLDLPSGKGNVKKALGIWFKNFWNKKKIAKLEKCVAEHQKILDSRILMELLTTTNANAVKQSSDFSQLDRNVQELATLVAAGHTNMKTLGDELKLSIATGIDDSTQVVTGAVSREAAATRDHIDTTLAETDAEQQRMRKTERDLKAYEILLKSVQSEAANRRRREVADAHESTFRWIYDPGNTKAFSVDKWEAVDEVWRDVQNGQSDDNVNNGGSQTAHICNQGPNPDMGCFSCWLSSSRSRPYWISGKPGSGKSTLMRFIATSPRTRSTLEQAHGQTMILSHFIWLKGHEDQRSRRGILLSLVYQYLTHIDDDTAKIELMQSLAASLQSSDPEILRKRASSEWSYRELEGLFLSLLNKSQCNVMIFVDGLDEVGAEPAIGPPSPVLGLIDKLCALPRVHVCVSSRPEEVFVKKFANDKKLTLQELTRRDILKYAYDLLRPFHAEDATRRNFIQKLANEVWRRSEGVFLWACIATKNLAEALVNGDDDDMVTGRLQELPSDINDLYTTMLKRLNDGQERYRPYAAEYLQIVLRSKDAVIRGIDDVSLITDFLPEDQVKKMLQQIIADPRKSTERGRLECGEFGKKVTLRTAYLLEVADDWKVRFLHRSAADFLDTTDGQKLLSQYELIEESQKVLHVWRRLLFVALKRTHQLPHLIEYVENNVLDSQPQAAMSLLHTCQRLHYSWRPPDPPVSLDYETCIYHDSPSFNWILAWGSAPRLLYYTMTVDIGTLTMDEASRQKEWHSQQQLPLVYSQEYLYSLLYPALFAIGEGPSRVKHDRRCYELLMKNICCAAKPPRPLKTFFSIATAIMTSWHGDSDRTLEPLRTALQMDGAWDEKPVFTFTRNWDGYCSWNRKFFRLDGSGNAYMFQATMGFAVYSLLSQLYLEYPEISDNADIQFLQNEINSRYPSGIPPAHVFAGYKGDGDTDEYYTLPSDLELHISSPQANPRGGYFAFGGRRLPVEVFWERGYRDDMDSSFYFFDASHLDKRIVSEKEFEDTVSRRMETAFDYTV